MEILTPAKAALGTDLLNAVPALISYLDNELRLTYGNAAFLEYFQTTPEGIQHRPVAEVLGKDIFQPLEKHFQNALADEQVSCELLVRNTTDHALFEISIVPDSKIDGTVKGLIFFATRLPDKTRELYENQKELRKSEDRYHRMLDEVQDYAIILLDNQGNILDWNKGAEKIKGYKAAEIIGQNFRIFYLPEDRQRGLPETLINKAVNEGKAEHEGWRVRKDGTRFWGSIVITALHDDNGETIGFSKVTRDLSQRRALEEHHMRYTEELERKNEQLRMSEERYQKMVAEVEDYAIILLDKNGDIQNWNRGAEKIKGYKAEEIQGKNFRVFYLPEDRRRKLPEQLIETAIREGKAVHEGWRMKKDGTWFWGSIVITALHDSEGNTIGFTKVTRDLSEKKLLEERNEKFTSELQQKNEELRRSEERYHRMVAEVEDYAIILLDVNGNIQNWNRGAENIKGYKAEEIIGKHFSVFYSPEDIKRKLAENLLHEARTTGKATHEGWRLKKDGTKFWGSVVITALHDDKRNIIGFSKVTRDLTERKIAEDRQKQNAEQLEAQNKELEQFAYVASHDLQEPLRKIRTFNSLIIEHEGDKLSEKAKDYFNRSIAAADRMNKLIEDLLTYSRATRDAHQFEQVDLNLVLARIRSGYKESDTPVLIESDPLPVLSGMRFQFEQLFDNLISNGVKYQAEGNTPHIRVRYRVVNGSEIKGKSFGVASRFHEISFADNGIGFDQQYADKIFEMFHRLHGRSEYSGSGIGLAVVKKIVQNYGGFITAEGNPGEGAVFNIYFPL